MSLDILAFNALDAERHLLRVTNDELLHLLGQVPLRPEQQRLYARLLEKRRSRYVAHDTLADLLDTDFATRYGRYRDRAAHLARRCVDDLFAGCRIERRAIRAVVTNTTVGGVIPPLSSVIGNHLGLPHDFRPLDIAYMGCAAALVALEAVERQLRPGEVGLVLSSELTSVMVSLGTASTGALVGNAVFGDGVGAFLVARRPHRERPLLRVRGHCGSVQVDPRSLTTISFEPGADYHEIRLGDAQQITGAVKRGVRQVLAPLVRKHCLSPLEKLRYALCGRTPNWQRSIDYALLHTAGESVLRALAEALGLKTGQYQHNIDAFSKYGNTSSASVYYTLDELTRRRSLARGERLLCLTYGSGFMVRAAMLDVM